MALPQKTSSVGFDFSPKFRGCLEENLTRISHLVNPGFSIEPGAVDYVERMLIGLLLRLLDSRPSNVTDLKTFVLQTFPTELIRCHGNGDCRTPTGSNPSSRKPTFQMQKAHAILKEILNYRLDVPVLNYALAVLEYIAADILRLTGRYVKNMGHTVITFQDLKVSLTADPILMNLFFGDGDEALDSLLPHHSFLNGPQFDGQQARRVATTTDSSSTYAQTVKDLINDETQYLRDLNMLILVFHNAFAQLNENGVNGNNAGGVNRANGGAYDNLSPNLYENEPLRRRVAENLVDLDRIFSNALDVREFTSKFLALLEDTVEMSRDHKQPSVGTCFSEMAQAYEFDVYHKYIEDVMNSSSLDYLYSLLDRDIVVRKHLQSKKPGFELAAKYVLPRLLLIPVLHCPKYFEYITRLSTLTTSKDDSTDLQDAESLLVMLRKRIELHSADLVRRNALSQFQLRFFPCGHTQLALAKMSDLMKQVDGFDTKAAGTNAGEFILEGTLSKYHMLQPKLGNTLLGATDTLRNKVSRTTERYVFLFDTMIVLCKPLSTAQLRRAKESVMSGATGQQNAAASSGPSHNVEFLKYKFKECFQMRLVEIVDREDTEDVKNAFEIRPNSGHIISQALGPVLLLAKTPEGKQMWMACLILLQTRGTLERMLDTSLAEEEKRIPLLLPSPDQYKFAEKDSEENIHFEIYSSSSGLPIVQAATLPKLIERLTPNQHADPIFCKMFLTTFRSFCEQRELLSLLVERFHVPDPPADPGLFFDSLTDSVSLYVAGESMLDSKFSGSPTTDADPQIREIIKKFRKKYTQPVQIRVLNVLKHWVDDHWYDFNRDPELLESLKDFLRSVDHPNYKHISKWAKNIRDIIARKEEAALFRDNFTKEFHFMSEPPPVEWYLTKDPAQFNLMTLHPVEIARQVTLLEFELYRAVKPFELVDARFTTKDKSNRSPQLTKLMKHSTSFAYWLELCVVSCQNLDERVAVFNRILEIMCVFEELNNFNGLMEIYGALVSAPVDRLTFTWDKLDRALLRKFAKIKELYADPRHKNVRLKLKEIDPPCVPFFGTYLTSLTYLNENKTFLQTSHSAVQSDAFHQQQQNGRLDTASIITVEENLSNVLDNNPQLINVAKCRKIYEVICEVQLYQDQAYCLRVEPAIRGFFESLNPLQKFNDNANDLQTYLFDCSLKIEPKNVDKAPYFPPSLEVSTLKSPGTKLPKGGKIKHLSTATPPSSIFTPLHRLGKEKPVALTSVPSTSQANSSTAAPASPTSSKDAPFSIIDIEPGKPPRYIRDVLHSHTASSPRDGGVVDVATASRVVGVAARFAPLSDPTPPPAIPPRPSPRTESFTSSTTSTTLTSSSTVVAAAPLAHAVDCDVRTSPLPSLPRLAPRPSGQQRQQVSKFNFPDVSRSPARSCHKSADDAVVSPSSTGGGQPSPLSGGGVSYADSTPPTSGDDAIKISSVGASSAAAAAAAAGVQQPPRIPPRRGASRPPAPLPSASPPPPPPLPFSSNGVTASSACDDDGFVVVVAPPKSSSSDFYDVTTTARTPPPPPLDVTMAVTRASSSDTLVASSTCDVDDVFVVVTMSDVDGNDGRHSTTAAAGPPLPPRSRHEQPPPRPPKNPNQLRACSISNVALAPPPLPPKSYR